MSEAEDSGTEETAVRRCTTCKMPVKGHKGQSGKYCQNIISYVNEGSICDPELMSQENPRTPELLPESVEEAKCTKDASPDNTQFLGLMSKLLDQMTSVNVNLQAVVTGQDKLATMISNQSMSVSSSARNPSTSGINSGETEDTVTALTGKLKVPFVPEKVLKSAVAGEFINLLEFLPSNEILRSDNDANHSGCQCCDHNGAGGNRKSRSKKSIDNFDTWLSAWNNYEVVIIDHKPEYYSNLAAHRQMIQKCSHKYYWQAVYTYDLRIRAKHGAMKSFRFNEIDTDLFVTVLDSTAVKQNAVRCLRCKGYDHLVQDCPFQTEYQVEKAQKYAKGKEAPGKRVSSQEKWFHNKQEGCNN